VSAILILLALLSIATIAARRGYARFVAHMVTVPLLLAAGIVAAPHTLALMTPSTLDALEPALRVGVVWLALLVGMRGVRPSISFLFATDTVFALAVALLTWFLLGAVAFGLVLGAAVLRLGFFEPAQDWWTLVGCAALLGGLVSETGLAFSREALQGLPPTKINRRVLFLARHDEILGALALCVGVALWPLPAAGAPVYETPIIAAGLVVALGATLGVAQLFSGGERMGGTTASVVALIGLTTFAAGLAVSTHLPGAAIAFFFGGVLAVQGRGEKYSRLSFAHSDRPVRIVVVVLVGAQLGFLPAAIAVGVALALARAVVKLGVRWLIARERRAELPPSSLLGSAGSMIPFALSFALARPDVPVAESEVLVAVCTCVAVTDLLTLVAWRRQEQGASP
jgi:hypothetical protein